MPKKNANKAIAAWLFLILMFDLRENAIHPDKKKIEKFIRWNGPEEDVGKMPVDLKTTAAEYKALRKNNFIPTFLTNIIGMAAK
jgi:hypothetical protein